MWLKFCNDDFEVAHRVLRWNDVRIVNAKSRTCEQHPELHFEIFAIFYLDEEKLCSLKLFSS